MTNPYEMFGTDKNLESGKGVIVDYNDFEFTIHRAGGSNKKYSEIIAAKYKPLRRKHEQGILENDIANKVLIEAFAEAVVLGWKNVKDEEGNLVEFSVTACIKLFTDLPELFMDIQEQANDISNFKKEVEDIEVKN